MALTGAPFPYDIDNLLGGAVRVLYAPTSTAIPTSIDDVVSMVAPYAAQTGWTDLGATKESFTYSRSFDTSGYEIQQVSGNILEEITDITRTIEVSIAEFKPEHLQLIEGAPAITAVAAGANVGAQDVVAFGSFSSLTRYRFAFISRRATASGVVTEPGGATRGRFFMGAAYSAQLSADSVDFEQAKGELTAVGVSFALFPESGEDSGAEYGAWFDEQSGTIAAV